MKLVKAYNTGPNSHADLDWEVYEEIENLHKTGIMTWQDFDAMMVEWNKLPFLNTAASRVGPLLEELGLKEWVA